MDLFDVLCALWIFFEVIAVTIGVFGNSLVIHVMRQGIIVKKQSKVCMISIAIADLLNSISVIPLTIMRYNKFKNPDDISHRSFCVYLTSFFLVSSTVSVLQFVIVSIERFLAICRPIFYHTRTVRSTKVAIVLCWIVGAIFGTTPLMTNKTGNNCSLHIAHYTILSSLAIVSVTAITVLYCLIYRAFRNQVMQLKYNEL